MLPLQILSFLVVKTYFGFFGHGSARTVICAPLKNAGAQCRVSDVTFRVANWRSLFSCYSSHVHINRGSSLCMKSISLISQLVCLPALHTNRLILSPPLCLSYLINAFTHTQRLMLSVSICQLHIGAHTDLTFCLMSL